VGSGIITYAVNATTGLNQTSVTSAARFTTLNPAEPGMGMYYSNGLLYADTGAIVSPSTQQTVGTFYLGGVWGAEYAVGPIAIDPANNRAFAMVCQVYDVNRVCSDNLMSFDATTYVPVVTAGVQGFNGYALRLAQIGPTSFASLAPNGDIALVSSSAFAQ
jgi:hypothetical protein